MQGLIIKAISGEYTVLLDNSETIVCKPLGIFRHKNIIPKVGDRVNVLDKQITSVYPRKNDLIRPFIANVDKVFIVTSLTEPSINFNLLDRLISEVEYCDIPIILVFTKADLVDITKYKSIFDYYQNLGYKIYYSPTQQSDIKKEINNKICVVAGQSGVGKSTLINLFSDFNIKTSEISQALGRGKHTTRHVELLNVLDGWIADTPGFGKLDLSMDSVALSHTFKEFFSCKCKYNGCLHINEPGCSVKEKVQTGEILKSRYESYILFNEEIKKQKKY